MNILAGAVIIAVASAVIGFIVRGDLSISHLPKFSGIIHYTCNDKWSFCYRYGDIVLRVRNNSGHIHDVYIVGHMNTLIKLSKKEIEAINKLHPVCKLEIEERSE